MKKLITAIAAIATSFGLFAADFAHSVTNDICFKTNNLVVGYDAMGATMLEGDGTAMTVNWFADSLKTDFHTNIANYEQPELKVSDTEPSYKYLAIDTDVKDPVLRTFSPVMKAEGTDNYDSASVTISDHGVFIDTETTFTLFDTVPESPSDSKILVWAKETEADEDAGIAGATNLMVTCGWYDAGQEVTVPTNYVLAVNGIVPEQMYRLTIRADKDGANNTKFRVYLNGVQLKTVPLDDQDTTLDEFPSLVDRTQELGAAGFGGTGSLKGIDLLTELDALDKTPFAVDPTIITVNWDDGVKDFTLAGVTYDVSELDYTSTNIVITPNIDFTLTTNFKELKKADWWDSDKVIGFTQDKDEDDEPLGSATFSIAPYVTDATVTLISQSSAIAGTLEVNGETIRSYSSLAKVLAAIVAGGWGANENNTIKITIGSDTTADENFGEGIADNISEATLIIDLAGHTITGVVEGEIPEDDFYIIHNWTTMRIMDSVGGGKIIAGDDFSGVIYNEWDMTIEQPETGNITFEGAIGNYCEFYDNEWVSGYLTLLGGRYSEKPTTGVEGHENDGISLGADNELAWTDQKIDGYWQLRTPGEVVVVVPALTTGLTIESIVTNSVSVENPVAGTYTVKENQSVVVTYAPDTGYEFADDAELGVRTATESGTITPPEVAAIPVTLTVTAGTGVESVTYTVNDVTAGSTVKIGDVIKITDVTYATGYEADGTYVKDYEYTVVAADVTAGSISWTVGAKKQTFTVTVDASNATLSTNGAPVAASSFTAAYGTEFTLMATAADGYKDAKIKIDDVEVTSLTVTKPTTIVVTATQMATWTVTVDATLGEHVLSVTPDPASVREDAASKTITLSATFESGYKRAYFTVDGVQIEGNTFEITKSVTVNAVAQAEQTDPTPVDPSQGTIVSDGEGNFVITPAADVTEITVQNAGDNNFIVDVPTDFTIKGVAAGKITVKCNGEDITAVCKGGNAEGFSTELDPTQTTPELIEATATEQPLVVGTTVDLKIKQSVPGLAYRLLRVGEVGDFSDSEKITPVATQKGNGETLTLTDANKPANKAFYKVAVGKDVIND